MSLSSTLNKSDVFSSFIQLGDHVASAATPLAAQWRKWRTMAEKQAKKKTGGKTLGDAATHRFFMDTVKKAAGGMIYKLVETKVLPKVEDLLSFKNAMGP